MYVTVAMNETCYCPHSNTMNRLIVPVSQMRKVKAREAKQLT